MHRDVPRVLWNLLLGGAIVRFLTLGVHSLWLDEGATWSWAVRPTWGGTFFAEANHPPVWWLVTRAWISMFGDSEWSLRAPAALLGVLLIWLSYQLGLRLLDPSRQPARGGFDRAGDPGEGQRAALWFAGFVAASTYFIEYAQEARMYALLLVEAVGLSLLYLRWLDKNDRVSLVGYALLAALALHTQYFAIWPIAAHGAHALWLRWRTRNSAQPVNIWPMLLAITVSGVLFLPWFLWMLSAYEGISTGDSFNPLSRLGYVIWRIGAGPGLVVVDRLRLEEGQAVVMQEELATLVVTSLLWFPALVFGALALRKRPGVASFVVASLAVPIVLVLAVFPVFQLVHERYLVFLAPFVWLLATMGATLSPRPVRPLVLTGLLVLVVAGLVAWGGGEAYLTPLDEHGAVHQGGLPVSYGADPNHPLRFLDHGHPFGKEPWREAHRFIEERAALADPDAPEDGPGDLVLLHPGYLHLVWDYYDRRALDRVLLPEDLLSPEEILKRHGASFKARSRVFLVLAHEETENPDAYFSAVGAAVFRAWSESSGTRIEITPPILFDRSWGVRVAIFNRR